MRREKEEGGRLLGLQVDEVDGLTIRAGHAQLRERRRMSFAEISVDSRCRVQRVCVGREDKQTTEDFCLIWPNCRRALRFQFLTTSEVVYQQTRRRRVDLSVAFVPGISRDMLNLSCCFRFGPFRYPSSRFCTPGSAISSCPLPHPLAPANHP